MRKYLLQMLGFVAALMCSNVVFAADVPTSETWVVNYHNNAPLTDHFGYDLVVLDPDQGYDVRTLISRGQTVLAYLSIGEVENYRSVYQQVKGTPLILMENKNWPGSYYVDVRNPKWTQLLIETVIPNLLRQGYNGLMLDTIDNPIDLARRDPKKYAGMDKAAANLVKTIRHQYPNIHIMLNRGFEILPQVAPSLNSVLAESTYTTYDFEQKKAKNLKPDDRKFYTNSLAAAQKRNAKLKVYSLDYWPLEDTQGVKAIYKAQRANGYVPYVSTVALDAVHLEPEGGE